MADEQPRSSVGAAPDSAAAGEVRDKRTKLKIFFGYAPGVGKTHSMLESARRLKDQGVDVVVGCAETHGRPETAALLEGLESLPRREITCHGTRFSEFDLDRALARKPAVLLVDELAHTNAPDCRHPKRWQDVLELLDAGIEVHTTLNVQHVESLNDVIEQITFVRVRETVPDTVLERADEIELVDLPPEELLERLREGKVYLPEEARRATERFFRRGNLLALRELALRRTAERVDVDVREYRREFGIRTTWPAAERLMVCVGPSPSSARIVRGARRMAVGLRAPWVAAYVDAPDAFPMSPADRERLQGHLRLAESLGGEVVRLSGSHVSAVLLDYARRHNVTRIVIGKPTRRRWRDLLKGSLVDELARGSGEIEVHFIAGDQGTASPPTPPAPRSAFRWQDYIYTALLVAAATSLGIAAGRYLALPDVVTFYLLVIMISAFRFGRGPSLAAAALSVAAYDFFFVPPFYTFSVHDVRHVLTFGVMFVVGLAISGLTSRTRRQEREARVRETRTGTLYALTRELVGAPDAEEAARIAARHAADVFGGEAFVLLPDASGGLAVHGRSGDTSRLGEPELAVARWALDHGRPAGQDTDTLPGADVVCIPLQSGPRTLGVLALRAPSREMLELEHQGFLDAFVRQVMLAVERARLSEEAKTAALRVKTEEMRSSILSSVSHDLRTPLAAITGAGTALRDDRERLGPAQRAELLDTVCLEAERMERLVANLLDMVRLESGAVALKREWVPLEEVVGSALARLEPKLTTRQVVVDLPEDLSLVSLDPVLFEQVLVNLLDNALKYTPEGSPLELRAARADGAVEIEVADRGPGLPTGSEAHVFEKFYRGAHPGVGGVGLGLPICRGIVQAHGGTIAVERRAGGGASFRIRLPPAEQPPSMTTAGDEPPDGKEPTS